MNYYQCPIGELRREAQRRYLDWWDSSDEISEALQKHDERKGIEATTLTTERPDCWELPFDYDISRTKTAEFGKTAPGSLLINERIVYWSMNTFFPTLQLFFESGLSCTLDGGSLSGAAVFLDPALRFRLTECTHEEDGRLIKTMRPDKFAQANTGIRVDEVVVGRRTSIAVKTCKDEWDTISMRIVHEPHVVIGLKLEGMGQMAYVYAKAQKPSGRENRIWGDVRLAGLRDDVPCPSVVFPMRAIKPGQEMTTVSKKSQITVNSMNLVIR